MHKVGLINDKNMMNTHVCCTLVIWQHTTFGKVPSHEELMIAKGEGWQKLELTTRLIGNERLKESIENK